MDITVMDTGFNPIAIIDTYESLIWTDRYDSYGDFELYLPMSTELFTYLKEDYYLRVKESDHCMIIENIKIETNAEDGDRLIVTGRSLESILDRRIIWGQNTYSGTLQEGIQSMLNDAIISPTIEERKLDNFIFTTTDNARIAELTIDNQYTGDNLYEVINGLCNENNIGFKIILNDENQFEFSLYAGANRSYDQTDNPYVIFSPSYENILSSDYYSSKAELKNVTLVGGEGEGASRRTTTVGTASGLDRRELFTDARDISSDTEDGEMTENEYMDKLKNRGLDKLSECIQTTEFEGEVKDERLFTYGEDFFIGDIVQIADGYGNEMTVYISELIISNSEDGLSIYPTFVTIKE